ncbi:Vesicle transport protein SFT2B [Bagarius yarrelli]|uniref:Vesicle transport protein n=1 Tax=Bagarius yarrelli TaxID=175774 RepID=A0A556TTK3_BAGYA|nr:Vesicle transport protein SFT2B [Bagarius yarrelli]
MDKLKKVLSGQDGNDDLNVLQGAGDATTLGWGTRVKAFIACFVLGVVCSILGSCLLWVPKRGIILFAIFYTFGNVASLLSTMFLMGPLKQVKRMCDKTRALATAIMIWRVELGTSLAPPLEGTRSLPPSLPLSPQHLISLQLCCVLSPRY